MATINLHCNSPSQIHSNNLLQAKNSMIGGAYIHGRSADTNLAEIHEEISELLDTQVNVKNESLFQGITQAPASPQKSV